MSSFVPSQLRKSRPMFEPYISDEESPVVVFYPNSHPDDIAYLQGVLDSGEFESLWDA